MTRETVMTLDINLMIGWTEAVGKTFGPLFAVKRKPPFTYGIVCKPLGVLLLAMQEIDVPEIQSHYSVDSLDPRAQLFIESLVMINWGPPVEACPELSQLDAEGVVSSLNLFAEHIRAHINTPAIK